MPDIGKGFVFADEPEAQRACEWWKKQLGVHYDCRVSIVPSSKVKAGCQADVSWIYSSNLAFINLVRPEDLCDEANPIDMEESIVHELQHLLVTPWDFTEGSDAEPCCERLYTFNARALVNLRRLAYPEVPWRCK